MDSPIATTRPARLDAIDLVRGIIMVIMALDHVRDFISDRLLEDVTNLKTTTPALFLTRWITHYCAPNFIFLAGTSAFLAGTRGKSTRELSWFLFTRGLWLAIFEITFCRALWMFNYDFYNYGAGVFWAIGLSMIVLSGLVFLPTPAVTLIGLAMIGSHNLLDGLKAEQVHIPELFWMILHNPSENIPLYNGCPILFSTAYCVIPWSGVMAAGYGFGSLFLLDQSKRRKWFLVLGTAAIISFIALRATNWYGDAQLWQRYDNPLYMVLSFINCTKYPPSLLFLLMTIGPAMIALAIFDRPLPKWTSPIIIFGRVPLFYYILHVIFIHGGTALIDTIRFGWSPLLFGPPWELPKYKLPEGYGVSLPTVYLLWIVVVLMLYLPCRWYAGFKACHKSVWLSYL